MLNTFCSQNIGCLAYGLPAENLHQGHFHSHLHSGFFKLDSLDTISMFLMIDIWSANILLIEVYNSEGDIDENAMILSHVQLII